MPRHPLALHAFDPDEPEPPDDDRFDDSDDEPDDAALDDEELDDDADDADDEADAELDEDDDELEEEFPLGDGAADGAAFAHCPYCGEPVEVLLDAGGGDVQEYVEDCEVCCRPWRVQVRYHRDGTADVRLLGMDE